MGVTARNTKLCGGSSYFLDNEKAGIPQNEMDTQSQDEIS